MGLRPSTLEKFRKAEPWIVGTLLGKLPQEEEDQAVTRHFLDVHAGVVEPQSEIERMWMAYWDRTPPLISELETTYLSLAESLHHSLGHAPGVTYENVVAAYRIASLCGSVKAEQWLEEQKFEPIKENSFWRSVYKNHWNVS